MQKAPCQVTHRRRRNPLKQQIGSPLEPARLTPDGFLSMRSEHHGIPPACSGGANPPVAAARSGVVSLIELPRSQTQPGGFLGSDRLRSVGTRQTHRCDIAYKTLRGRPMQHVDSTGRSCPRCESPKTEIVPTIHPNDPLYFCFTCRQFWRPSTLDEKCDTAFHQAGVTSTRFLRA